MSSRAQKEVDNKVSSARYRCPLSQRAFDRFIAEGGKSPYPDME
jgi:hypothetical protein